MDRLSKADPSNVRLKRDLAVSYAKIAATESRPGDDRKALVDLRAGLEVLASLGSATPNDEWQNGSLGLTPRSRN
jgi:hypothetical protein